MIDRRSLIVAGGGALALAAGGVRAGTADTLAFTGALGWAARTGGGRGGRIVRVSSLASAGEGSLREALAASGPRIVVFEVGGVIDLEQHDLELTEPFVTIAGQTAPEPGVTLKGGGLHIRTHDVVVRHLRIRPGAGEAAPGSGWNVDGLGCVAAHDVIVDQCSFSWATDENLSASGPRFDGGDGPEQWRRRTSHRITFSRNIIAEGLSHASHSKGEHSKGTLIHDNATEILIAGNLYAHNFERNPLFKGGTHVLAANNLIYNPGNKCMNYAQLAKEWGPRTRAPGRIGLVGNVAMGGLSSRPDLAFLTLQGDGVLSLHMQDNLAHHADGRPMDLIGHDANGDTTTVAPISFADIGAQHYRPAPSSDTKAWVLSEAGARPWSRDAVDARLLAELQSGAGRIIDHERDVGGLPEIRATYRRFREDDWDLAAMVRRDGRPS